MCGTCWGYADCKSRQSQDGPSLRACQRVIEQLYYADIRDKDVLEIGCGTREKGGFIKNIVESNNCRWTGIDILKTDLATHVCSVEKMPFDDSSFDYVVGSQSLEHWKKPKKALTEIRRVLRPDGTVSLTAPIHLHGEKMFVRGDFDAIEKLFVENGFKIERFETWRKHHSDLSRTEPNEYVRRKLREAGIVNCDDIEQYVIHCMLTINKEPGGTGFWEMLFGRRSKISNLSEMLGCESGKSALIIGAGGSIREHEESIRRFIRKAKPVTYGINNMTGFCVPDYHLWTNQQRYRDFGNCINAKSKMMFGYSMPPKLIKKHFKGNYIRIDYTKEKNTPVGYRKGTICGDFRTAGCLAIMIAHFFEASRIYIVGMDGFTLHGRKELEECAKNQHCYGKGYTDDATWEECVRKDEMVYETLKALDEYGVKFEILTPTKFEKFYSSEILESMASE